jgi:citrate synthase
MLIFGSRLTTYGSIYHGLHGQINLEGVVRMSSSGLDGVIVDSHISCVDGQAGQLILRGHPLEEIESWSYEEVGAMLWQRPIQGLGLARQRVTPWIRPLVELGSHLSAIEWLRFALDRLPAGEPEDWVAALGVALALRRNPQAEPDPSLGHVEDVARMASLTSADGLRRYWVCVAEHGMNASTFTARVVASTRAGERAAVSAALGALQGPLHGGAPGPVLDMLDELARHPDPAAWLGGRLSSGQRLMGFGHRIYRVRDPRAEVLRRACQNLQGRGERLAFAERMEQLAGQALRAHKPDRVLQTNVEYYTALLLDGLGFERDEFTAVFACGRVLGWLAHVFEQEAEGRLIRPEVRYLGPAPVLVNGL